MPKIIENLREQLLSEAKKQVKERGYAATTVRSVAGACGVGVGTVYNYFKSKEMLIATFVYDDWRNHLAEMERLPDEPYARLSGIYSILTDPIELEHTAFFRFKRKAEKPILAMFERRNRK